MLKRIVLVGLAVALLVPTGLAAAWLWGLAAGPAAAQTPAAPANYQPSQTITVVGNGKVNIRPDIARVSVGVETSAETVAEAVDQNATQMETIMAALKAAGIAEKDIQTTNFSINLERYPEPMSVTEQAQAKPVYRVSNMVNVNIRKLDTVADVLDAVIEAGANSIWGVTFTLEDQSAAEASARADAIADAQARAQALAELSGVKLGPVMSISEVVGGNSYPLAVAEKAMGGGGPISPGELEIQYQVQVSYFIEPGQ